MSAISPLLWAIPVIIIVAVIIALLRSHDSSNLLKGIIATSTVVILVGTVLVPAIEDADREDLDVFIVAGQSNAAYLHYDLDLCDPKVGEGYAYYYGTSTSPIVYGSHSTPSYDPTLESYSIQSAKPTNLAHLEAPFSETYHALTGHNVVTINVGISGTTIQEWQSGEFAWTYASSVIDDALDKLSDYDLHLKGFIWIQGESNSSMSEEDYTSYFLNTFGLFKDKGFEDCFISKVRRDTSTTGQRNPVGPSNAQIAMAQEYPHIHMATEISDTFTVSNGLMETDNLHYNQRGQNLIGVAVGEYCANYY